MIKCSSCGREQYSAAAYLCDRCAADKYDFENEMRTVLKEITRLSQKLCELLDENH